MSLANWWDDLNDGDPDGLAWFQREAVKCIFADLARVRSTMIVLATGLGKTQVAGAFINEVHRQRRGARILFLAHRDELVTQARDRIEQMTGEIAGIEQAGWRSESSDRIVVGSTQSVTQKSRLERLGHDRFDYIICDEIHRYLAPTFKRCVKFFDTAKVVGDRKSVV
jgi:superfamily II DNA or RNA helicase